MPEFPKIQRAIPQKRYQYGDYAVAVLGDIESGDARDYRFVAAFVPDGESQPRLYVACERAAPDQRARGAYALRVVNSAMDEVMDVDDRWGRLDEFCTQALQLGAQLLGLEQETPYPLM
jgi:hypothetical protein